MAYLFSGDSGDSDSAVVPLVCLRPFPLLLFASVPVCFILSAALVMMMKVPAFCYWFGCLFCAGMSAEMKAMAMTILYVCCISFLSFSLCIISLLWVFCSVFSAFFLCFFWVLLIVRDCLVFVWGAKIQSETCSLDSPWSNNKCEQIINDQKQWKEILGRFLLTCFFLSFVIKPVSTL